MTEKISELEKLIAEGWEIVKKLEPYEESKGAVKVMKEVLTKVEGKDLSEEELMQFKMLMATFQATGNAAEGKVKVQ